VTVISTVLEQFLQSFSGRLVCEPPCKNQLLNKVAWKILSSLGHRYWRYLVHR